MDCSLLVKKESLLLEDKLSHEEELAFKNHLRNCPDCFERLVRRDPSFSFILLAEREDPGELHWRSLEKDILRAVDGERNKPGWNVKRTLLAAAASLVLLVSFWFTADYFTERVGTTAESLPIFPPEGSSIERVGLEIETTEGDEIPILKYEFSDGVVVDWIISDQLVLPEDPS